jgi:hypothetical protein
VYDTEKLSERIAKLSGGVAVIKVGAVAGMLVWLGRSVGWLVTIADQLQNVHQPAQQPYSPLRMT